ncbi:uncharacterized protein LOC144161886 [Haemaphysalis longicornis]
MLQQTGDEDGIRHEAVKMATAPASIITSNFGKLPEFQPDSGNIYFYLERFELFVTANDIPEEKKLQLLLTAIGEKVYVTLHSLLLPKTPSKVTFEEAISVLKKHYAPKSSVVTERYRFNQRKQEAHESVTEFVVELKKLAATCEFGAFLEDAIQADAIRCRLLAMTDAELTWDRACSIATAMETTTQDTKEVFTGNNAGRAPGDTEVHWQRQATTSRPAARKAPFNRASPPKPSTRKKGKPKTFPPGSKPCHWCGGPHAPIIHRSHKSFQKLTYHMHQRFCSRQPRFPSRMPNRKGTDLQPKLSPETTHKLYDGVPGIGDLQSAGAMIVFSRARAALSLFMLLLEAPTYWC